MNLIFISHFTVYGSRQFGLLYVVSSVINHYKLYAGFQYYVLVIFATSEIKNLWTDVLPALNRTMWLIAEGKNTKEIRAEISEFLLNLKPQGVLPNEENATRIKIPEKMPGECFFCESKGFIFAETGTAEHARIRGLSVGATMVDPTTLVCGKHSGDLLNAISRLILTLSDRFYRYYPSETVKRRLNTGVVICKFLPLTGAPSSVAASLGFFVSFQWGAEMVIIGIVLGPGI